MVSSKEIKYVCGATDQLNNDYVTILIMLMLIVVMMLMLMLMLAMMMTMMMMVMIAIMMMMMQMKACARCDLIRSPDLGDCAHICPTPRFAAG